MKSLFSFFVFLGLCAAGVPAAEPASSPPKAADAQAALKAKGLSRVGAIYLLEGEAKLPEELRTMRAAKFRVDQNSAQRAKLEKAIDVANETILQCAREVSEATG